MHAAQSLTLKLEKLLLLQMCTQSLTLTLKLEKLLLLQMCTQRSR